MKYMKTMALLLAGSLFLSGCGGGKIAKDVEVNGIRVGGMPYAEAVARVRNSLERLPLTVRTPEGDHVAALDYPDNVEEVLGRAKKGASLTAEVRREWVEMERDLLALCVSNARDGVDAALAFSQDGFEYTHEINGIACDFTGICAMAQEALKTGKTEISLPCVEVPPEVTEEKLRARTQPLSEFSTKFDGSNAPRAHNIALAASRLSGTVIGPGEELSFNETVGKRTRENGFEEAAVIQSGEFVPGVGGGVCQASTTLFGAALRAGLEITESHPHSLSVGYVQPSQDAMVSDYSDLKIRNPYSFPVYLLGSAKKGAVEFHFFGAPDGSRYEVESEILFFIDPPPAEIVEGSVNRTLREQKRGIASESWLLRYGGDGTLLTRTLVRRDTYSCIRGIEERMPSPLVPEPEPETFP